ncbi:DNA primase [Culicoidibacter larvae]|uniref:DNA primase n=1 Tax=Culicoidibacter larvae TaxID=2579976 RepID=A0A5R8Q992_9FIRM|nr:DNA primase [Culicoidibacter larvae]TLG72476.1 DNA primase [Culicoidibacter larvae]
MAKIPEELIDEIRRKNNIVDVIGEYISLERKGRNYFACCPFHGEDTPSLSVSPEKQIFHCFGCHEGGNVFGFLMKYKNISFVEAVTELAARGNVELPTNYSTAAVGPKYTDQQQRLIEVHTAVTQLYEQFIKVDIGHGARMYLHQRGMNDEIIEQFHIGFAPDRQLLVEFLKSKGLSIEDGVASGLLHQGQSSYYDAFRNRIVFPIQDLNGSYVGFSGRIFGESDQAKYYNSPETEIFKKRLLLYNLSAAKEEIRKKKRVYLFEGIPDVIAAVSVGIKESVASLGTAFTKEQANLLKRYTTNVVICFDTDRAGMQAIYKTGQLLTELGFHVEVAQAKKAKDVDEYLQANGAEATKALLESPHAFLAFLYNYERQDKNLTNFDDRKIYIQSFFTHLRKAERLDQESYLQKLSEEFGLRYEALRAELDEQVLKDNPQQVQPVMQTRSVQERPIQVRHMHLDKYQLAERKLVYAMIMDMQYAVAYEKELNYLYDDRLRAIAYVVLEQYDRTKNVEASQLIDQLSEPERQVLSELFTSFDDGLINEAVVKDCIHTVKEFAINAQVKKLEGRLHDPTISVEEELAIVQEIFKIKNSI